LRGVPAVHHLPAEGPLLRSGADAIGAIYSAEADWIAVPVARLVADADELEQRLAGT
jgi:hypothetical protein